MLAAVFFIILDTSSGALSDSFGVNRADKLANAANTDAVQRVTVNQDGSWSFPATVDFSPVPKPLAPAFATLGGKPFGPG